MAGDTGGRKQQPEDVEIIGVAKTVPYSSLKRDAPAVSYLPYTLTKRTLGQMVYELRRAAESHRSGVSSFREVVRQADARVPVFNIMTQENQIERTISQERTFAMLCVAFALLALTIACVGLYGMMAGSVARRTNEIGIRMALGAERGRLIRMVLREVLWMAVVGTGIGLAAAFSTSHLVRSFLFRMEPNDPLALGLSAAAF